MFQKLSICFTLGHLFQLLTSSLARDLILLVHWLAFLGTGYNSYQYQWLINARSVSEEESTRLKASTDSSFKISTKDTCFAFHFFSLWNRFKSLLQIRILVTTMWYYEKKIEKLYKIKYKTNLLFLKCWTLLSSIIPTIQHYCQINVTNMPCWKLEWVNGYIYILYTLSINNCIK